MHLPLPGSAPSPAETSIKLEGGLGQRVELGQGQAESPGRVEGAGQGHMSIVTQDPSTGVGLGGVSPAPPAAEAAQAYLGVLSSSEVCRSLAQL